jgi:hypothetical protein
MCHALTFTKYPARLRNRTLSVYQNCLTHWCCKDLYSISVSVISVHPKYLPTLFYGLQIVPLDKQSKLTIIWKNIQHCRATWYRCVWVRFILASKYYVLLRTSSVQAQWELKETSSYTKLFFSWGINSIRLI